MRPRGGQAMVELALVLPAIVAVGFGTVEVARVADARAGLDGAAMAAAAAAARAPSAATAASSAQAAFDASAAPYPLGRAALSLDLGGFARGGTVVARATAAIPLDMLPVPGLPRSLELSSVAVARVQEWRSR